jgi:hypothetical protein
MDVPIPRAQPFEPGLTPGGAPEGYEYTDPVTDLDEAGERDRRHRLSNDRQAHTELASKLPAGLQPAPGPDVAKGYAPSELIRSLHREGCSMHGPEVGPAVVQVPGERGRSGAQARELQSGVATARSSLGVHVI